MSSVPGSFIITPVFPTAGLPGSPDAPALAALHQAGLAAHRCGREAEAVEALTKVRDQFPDDVAVRFDLAQALLGLRQPEAALIEIERALVQMPAIPAVVANGLRLRALALARLRRLPEADMVAGQAMQRAPEMPEVSAALATVRMMQGRLVEADVLFAQSLRHKPEQAEALANHAQVLLRLNRSEDAMAAARQAAMLKPFLGTMHYLVGQLHRRSNAMTLAEAAWREAIRLDSTLVVAFSDLGDLLRQMERPAEAEAVCRQGLALDNRHVGLLVNLGAALQAQGKLEAAQATYDRLLAIDPTIAEAHNNIGRLHQEAGRIEAALTSFRQAVALKPDHPEFRQALTNLLFLSGQMDEASMRAVATIQPDDAETQARLGAVLLGSGQSEEAETCLRKALAIEPTHWPALANLANIQKNRGQIDEALETLRTALRQEPDQPELLTNYGLTLAAKNHPQILEQAVDFLRRAACLKPELPEVYCNMGLAQQGVGRLEEAIESYRQGLALRPGYPQVANNLATCLGNQGRLAEALDLLRQVKSEGQNSFPQSHSNLLFCINYDAKAERGLIWREHQEWGRTYGQVTPLPPAECRRDPDRRLRIGYVSPDLAQHPVGYFIAPVLTFFNRSEFEVICYSGRIIEDSLAQLLKSRVTQWRRTLAVSDEALAGQIRADGIDILVDLAGHTSGNRLPVFAYKPAPIQVSWLGYPNTTGLPAIDYRLVDGVTDPEDSDPNLAADTYSTETLIRLPNGFHCLMPPHDWPKVGPLPAHANGYITFGSFNNLVKVTPPAIAAWAHVLHRVPGSCFKIKSHYLADPVNRGRIRGLFEAHGIDSRRVTVIPWCKNQIGHLESFRQVDIALDTFPYNGTATTCEALWMGVPVVTWAGLTHAGRVSASLLTTLGQTDLIGASVDAYIDIAVSLAQDLPRLDALHNGLRDRFRASPLHDGPGFTRTIETAYRNMWRRWCMAE